jgi:hypothetical protein
MSRIEAAAKPHWVNALSGILELHRKVAARRYEEGFEAGARAHGKMRAAEVAVRISQAAERMQVVATRLEALVAKETKQ